MDPSTRLTLAPVVTPLQGPIYPVPSQFGDLNAELLQTGGATSLVGGGPLVSRFDIPETALEGGAYYAPVRDAQGELLGHINLSDLEKAVLLLGNTVVGNHQEVLQRLQSVITSARRTPPNRTSAAQAATAIAGKAALQPGPGPWRPILWRRTPTSRSFGGKNEDTKNGVPPPQG
eukprot:gene7689-biopygen4802